MSKSNAFENALLLLLLNNTPIADIGDATGLRGSVVAGSLFLSLHTADPGEAGNQSTSEVTYTGYGRATVARSAAGWTVVGNSATLTSIISFAAGTGGGGTATHFGLGTAASGAGVRLYKGDVTPNIVCGNGATPQLTTATTITED